MFTCFAAFTRLSGIWISESLLREEKVQLPLECHVMMTLQLLILASGLVTIQDSDKDLI